MFLTESLHKVSEFHFLYVNADNRRLLWVTCHCRKFLALLILVHILQDEVTRIHVEIGIHLQGGEVDYVTALVSGVVIPSVCVGIYNQHRFGVIALRSIVELHIPESLDRLLAESRHELRQRYVPDVNLCVSHRLFDYKFDMDTELSKEVVGVVTEHETLLDMGTENEVVREIEVSRHCQRTAVDKGIIGSDSGTVFQYLLAPVYRLITAESGNTAIEVKCLRVVADDMEIITDFADKLSDGDSTFLAVGLGLEILSAERPCVGVVALDYRVEHSDIIAAVAGLSDAVTQFVCITI